MPKLQIFPSLFFPSLSSSQFSFLFSFENNLNDFFPFSSELSQCSTMHKTYDTDLFKWKDLFLILIYISLFHTTSRYSFFVHDVKNFKFQGSSLVSPCSLVWFQFQSIKLPLLHEIYNFFFLLLLLLVDFSFVSWFLKKTVSLTRESTSALFESFTKTELM